MQTGDYQKLDHGLREERPIRIKHDLWKQTGPGLRDMHYDVELGVVLAGVMRREHGEWKGTFRKGCAWLNGIWEPHSAEVLKAPLELVMFHVQPELLAHLQFPEAPGIHWLAPFTMPPAKRALFMLTHCDCWLEHGVRMKKLSSAPDTWDNRVRIRLCLLDFLADTISRSPAADPESVPDSRWNAGLSRAVELVFSCNSCVTVEEAAAAAGMNRNDFSSRFRQLMGLPFRDFQLHRRLRAAATAMRSTDMPLKDIANRWGFADKSHFHGHFVRLFGCTPGVWRDRAKRLSV